MRRGAVRITAVPRECHPVSGLLAMRFAERYGDTVWALPATGEYVGTYEGVKFFVLDNRACKRVFGVRLVRMAFMLWMTLKIFISRRQFYFVHSFSFAVPLWLLRRRYYIFIHGTDRRFLDQAWGQSVARRAVKVFGIGFGVREGPIQVREVPNIFIPVDLPGSSENGYSVLFVLRNAPVKNPYFPIDLAKELGGQMGLRIGVVGVSVEELPENRAAELFLLQASGVVIDYLGRQSVEQVMMLMRASRVFFLPSFSEGIPKAALEAMYQGMDIVINKNLQLPRNISERCDAVALDDWRATAEAISRCLGNGRNAENMAFAKRYLEGSQEALISICDEIYRQEGA